MAENLKQAILTCPLCNRKYVKDDGGDDKMCDNCRDGDYEPPVINGHDWDAD